MDKRPQRPTPPNGPGSVKPPPDTRLGAEETPLPEQPIDEWAALGATRVLSSEVGSPPTPSPLKGEDTALPPPAAVEKSFRVLGEFLVQEKLGEGAMGAVYKAYQPSFQRNVALKVLFRHVANNPKLVERLHREGQTMGLLDHPNIVLAYGIGEAQGWHFIIMEYVDGQSLQKWLTRVGKLSVADALHIVLACARALKYAHENDLIHRDIKPDNVLITRDGRVKLADLGMVKQFHQDMSLTQTGHAVGTPWYMPLEQAKNAKDIDARSDIYALGCMLYCLLTGEPPFAGKTLVEVIQAKEVGTFPPARAANDEVPERLDLIIAKMAAKLPRYRYQTCAEVIGDLEGLDLDGDELEFIKAPVRSPEFPKRRTGVMHRRAADSGEVKSEDVWYLRFKSPEGQNVIRKLHAAQILELLDDKSFDPTAQASRNPTQGFRALATYKEFETAALSRVAKDSVDEKTVRFRNLYKKIEAQELAREKGHVKEPEVTTAAYWRGIVFQIGGICALIGLIIFLLWYFATGLGK
jgi:eukaryotic-like serine/threonine-protein kinase